MSTSLLYHAFGIRGYRYTRTDYLEGEVVFTIEQRLGSRIREWIEPTTGPGQWPDSNDSEPPPDHPPRNPS